MAHVQHMCQALRMTKMIQVRNVPEELHGELVRRAVRRGQTLTGYIQEVLEREVGRLDRLELLARIEGREPVDLRGTSAAQLIHEERESAGRR